MKKVLLFVLAGLLIATPALATVLTSSWGYHGSASADAKWKGYALTWATGGIADSAYTSILPDSTALDIDTTNAFVVAGLFNTQTDSNNVAVLVFHAVADTTIDSLYYAIDYSYDDVTWIKGTNWSTPIAVANNAAGTDTTGTSLIRANPSVVRGGQIFAPLWRVRVQTPIKIPGALGPNSTKKLKKLWLSFYGGGR